MNFVPLKIDVNAEDFYRSHLSWGRRISKWASKYLFLRIYYVVPYGRISLDMQLKKRERFPIEQWEETGVEYQQVQGILRLVAKEFHLPNEYLIPDDPLSMVLIPDYDEISFAGLCYEMKKQLGAHFEPDELVNLVSNPAMTVGLFTKEVFRRCPSH